MTTARRVAHLLDVEDRIAELKRYRQVYAWGEDLPSLILELVKQRAGLRGSDVHRILGDLNPRQTDDVLYRMIQEGRLGLNPDSTLYSTAPIIFDADGEVQQ